MNMVVLRETLRRQATNGGFVLGGVSIVILAAFVGGNDGPAQMWQMFLVLIALVAGCQLIGPEFSSGTLQLILSKPVNRSSYLLSRFAGVSLSLSAVAAAAFVLHAGCRLVFAQPTEPKAGLLAASTVNSALCLLLICALMALFGSFTRSYHNVAIYLILQLVLVGSRLFVEGFMRNSPPTSAVGNFLRQHPGVFGTLKQVRNNLYPSAPGDWNWRFALMAVTNVVIVLTAACLLFRRREVPYGAD